MSGGYEAAHEAVLFVPRAPRRLLRVAGRAPTEMLSGLVTGAMPPAPETKGAGIRYGRAPYSAMLTPKGRLVTDLRVARLGNEDEGALLLDLPDAGVLGALEHLRKYLPPRMAKVSELDEGTAILTLVGPRIAPTLWGEILGLPDVAPDLLGMEDGDEFVVPDGSEVGVRVIRSDDVSPLAFDVIGTEAAVGTLRSRLGESGVSEGEDGLWDVLRLERGRPSFGVELDAHTMPAEAGIEDRCVDDTKGCYTGQEVVVRIRDRGHVNRQLRGILLGGAPAPEPLAPLFQPGRDRRVGTIRSFAPSPRFGQGIALAYLRREVEPPAAVALGTPGGPQVQVRALTDDGWHLVEGDPTFYS